MRASGSEFGTEGEETSHLLDLIDVEGLNVSWYEDEGNGEDLLRHCEVG